MVNNQTSNQVPQFDPAATPAPPDTLADNFTPSAPGATVAPTTSLSDLESAVDEMTSSMKVTNLPPPPFDPTPQMVPQQDDFSLPQPVSSFPSRTAVDEDAVNQLLSENSMNMTAPAAPELPAVEAPISMMPPIQPQPQPEPVASPVAATPVMASPMVVNTDELSSLPIANPLPEETTVVTEETVPQEAPVEEQAPMQEEQTVIEEEVEAEDDEPEPEPMPAPKNKAKSKKSKAPKVDFSQMNYDDPIDYEELKSVKSDALKELAPIANELDQPPVERFKTLMELIQATDSTALVKPALEAARQIEDEKSRASALLSLVNEVEYLEHKDSLPDEDAK